MRSLPLAPRTLFALIGLAALFFNTTHTQTQSHYPSDHVALHVAYCRRSLALTWSLQPTQGYWVRFFQRPCL